MSGDNGEDFFTEICNIQIEEQVFKDSIKLFSKYLSLSNEEYKYNETYLPRFSENFLKLKKYIELKNDICRRLFTTRQWENTYHGYLLIEVDSYWIYEYKNSTPALYALDKIDFKKICSTHMEVKIIKEVDKKRDVYIQSRETLNNNGIDMVMVEKIIKEIETCIRGEE